MVIHDRPADGKFIIDKIIDELRGISYYDLTKAEKNIVDLLIEAKYVERQGEYLNRRNTLV